LSEAEQLEAVRPDLGRSSWLLRVLSLHCTDLMINTCMLSREAVLRCLLEYFMQVGPLIQGKCLSGPWIKLS
jgi:hypothetical protein